MAGKMGSLMMVSKIEGNVTDTLYDIIRLSQMKFHLESLFGVSGQIEYCPTNYALVCRVG